VTTETPAIGSEEEFEEFEPMPSPDGETFWNYPDTTAFPSNRVWSIVEGDGTTESLFAVPGYHIVNRLGYMVTAYPWTNEVQDYYWYDAKDEDEEDDEF
jgi:hypothetical protein